MNPAVTYIASAFNRPLSLRGCLASLQVQTDPDFEVIVADNAPDWQTIIEHSRIVESFQDKRFRHVATAQYATSPGWDCYWSAEWIVEHEAQGQWLCLPSDDSYYVPVFQEALLNSALTNNWQLVYCDMLYDRRIGDKYRVLNVKPVRCRIDKCGFLLQREVWIGFPNKPQEPGRSCCDGEMIEQLARSGVRHGKVHEVLCVHN